MAVDELTRSAPASGALPIRRGLPEPLPRETYDGLVRDALREDLADAARASDETGDLTSDAVVPEDRRALGRLVARAPGRLAGLAVFARVFDHAGGGVAVRLLAADGDAVETGAVVAELEGRARTLLVGERTALNFLQHLSGVATHTARFVERAGGARILDTRKTTPGLRALEKYAVRCGGGENHRVGLFDEVMIKDNHADLAGEPLAALVARARRRVGAGVRITAEARDAGEAVAAVEGGADVVLLDNFTPGGLAELCPRLREVARASGRAVELEASGGIGLANVAAVAASGVDRISVGELTHSAPALDLSLELEPAPRG